jgi:hypothetical protein
MARIKIDDDLKAAIALLKPAEKDKLLYRLIPKDEKLMRQLIFQLLDGGDESAREERAVAIKQYINKNLTKSGASSYSPGYLLMELRHFNARISEHTQATKDKLGEVTLPVFMIVEALRRHYDMMKSMPERRSDTLAPYLVKRTIQLVNKADKLHEDYHIEFRRDLNEILAILWEFKPTQWYAKELGLPKTWG